MGVLYRSPALATLHIPYTTLPMRRRAAAYHCPNPCQNSGGAPIPDMLYSGGFGRPQRPDPPRHLPVGMHGMDGHL